MNVLHINQSDIGGGAAIAGFRLHQGLLLQGIDSKILSGDSKLTCERIAKFPPQTRLEWQVLKRITERCGLNYIHLISSFRVVQHDFFRDANIVNFHNLHSGYFSYLSIPKLTQDKPGVLTLHDMWSFTGHCSYSFDCMRWETGCGECPYLDTYPRVERDSTALELKIKSWVYKHSNLTVVAPSSWLTRQARQSILNHFAIHHIPNGIDTSTYQPIDTELCRTVLNVPTNKFVLMTGADSLKDPRKGLDLLVRSLQGLPKSLKDESTLLSFGNNGEALANEVGIEGINLGYISSDRLKAVAYSAADLLVFTSRADNLPLILQESMACGTPMVAFNIGGVSDLVRPGITGYLAAPEDIGGLQARIIH